MSLRTTLSDTLGRPSNRETLLVISDSHVGSLLVSDVASRMDVHLVTDHEGVAGRAPNGVRVTVGDVRSLDTLAEAADADAAVVALCTDRTAILVTQLLRAHLDIDNLITVVNDPQRYDALDDLTTTAICRSTVLAEEIGRAADNTLRSHESHSS